MARDILPPVSVYLMQFKKSLFLFVIPRFFVDCRVEVVVPPFPALFACAFTDSVVILKFLCNFGPVVEAVFVD